MRSVHSPPFLCVHVILVAVFLQLSLSQAEQGSFYGHVSFYGHTSSTADDFYGQSYANNLYVEDAIRTGGDGDATAGFYDTSATNRQNRRAIPYEQSTAASASVRVAARFEISGTSDINNEILIPRDVIDWQFVDDDEAAAAEETLSRLAVKNKLPAGDGDAVTGGSIDVDPAAVQDLIRNATVGADGNPHNASEPRRMLIEELSNFWCIAATDKEVQQFVLLLCPDDCTAMDYELQSIPAMRDCLADSDEDASACSKSPIPCSQYVISSIPCPYRDCCETESGCSSPSPQEEIDEETDGGADPEAVTTTTDELPAAPVEPEEEPEEQPAEEIVENEAPIVDGSETTQDSGDNQPEIASESQYEATEATEKQTAIPEAGYSSGPSPISCNTTADPGCSSRVPSSWPVRMWSELENEYGSAMAISIAAGFALSSLVLCGFCITWCICCRMKVNSRARDREMVDKWTHGNVEPGSKSSNPYNSTNMVKSSFLGQLSGSRKSSTKSSVSRHPSEQGAVAAAAPSSSLAPLRSNGRPGSLRVQYGPQPRPEVMVHPSPFPETSTIWRQESGSPKAANNPQAREADLPVRVHASLFPSTAGIWKPPAAPAGGAQPTSPQTVALNYNPLYAEPDSKK